MYIYSFQQITKHRGWSMSLWAALPVVLRYVIALLLLSPYCWLMLAGKLVLVISVVVVVVVVVVLGMRGCSSS